jgi:hypothetical protein
LKLGAIGLDTARPFAWAFQGPHEGRPANPFGAEWKAISGISAGPEFCPRRRPYQMLDRIH